MNLWQRFKARRREQQIYSDCGCICWCPKCQDPLNDQASWVEAGDGTGTYKCGKCGDVSRWLFDAPVPIYLPPPTGGKPK